MKNHRPILLILSTYLLREHELSTPDPFQKGVRDLKQTTSATEMRKWKNKKSNWQNNSSARETFLSRPIQNNNVKSPQFASSPDRNRDGKLF